MSDIYSMFRKATCFAGFRTLLFLTAFLFFSTVDGSYAGDASTITSDKMKIVSKGEVSDFTGNVELIHKNLTINSDEMKLYEKAGDAFAEGNIYIHYSSGSAVTNVWGDTAKYNKNTGNGLVSGNVKIKRELTPGATDVINMTCNELEILDFGDRLHAIKNVKILKMDVDASGSEAFYEHKTNEILLVGKPATIKKTEGKTTSEYSGNRVHIDVKTETVTISGSVKTKVVLK